MGEDYKQIGSIDALFETEDRALVSLNGIPHGVVYAVQHHHSCDGGPYIVMQLKRGEKMMQVEASPSEASALELLSYLRACSETQKPVKVEGQWDKPTSIVAHQIFTENDTFDLDYNELQPEVKKP